MRYYAIAPFFLGLMACQPMGDAESSSASPQAETASAAIPAIDDDPVAFAQAACGGCHSVEGKALSPNPASPSFYEIANQPGLTKETLTAYLTDAHNYPEQMDFDLEPKHVEALTQLILELRDENYKLPVS